jgi:hypothetical protein
MKKLLVIPAVIVFMLVQIVCASARERDLVTKQKKVHNQYTVQDMDKLEIDNMYGKVHINTWDKNEITIDIDVTVKANTESEAQEMLDRISFNTASNENGNHSIYCRTMLEPMRHNIRNSEMNIDYTINMPKKNPIDITDKYGNVYVADFSGKMHMNVSYGNLDMQNISGPDKRIKVAFGNARISSLEMGVLDISYSNLTIDKAQNIDVTNKFGKSDISSVQNLSIDQKYGNVEIGTVNKVGGNVEYANFEVDNIVEGIELIAKYCGNIDLRSIGRNVDKVNLDIHYSNLYCHFAEDANLSADIAGTYSNFKKHASFGTIDMTYTDPDDTKSQHFKVKIGKGGGDMIINAHYSNINFK